MARTAAVRVGATRTIRRFVSRSAFDIGGLGPRTVAGLTEGGLVQTVAAGRALQNAQPPMEEPLAELERESVLMKGISSWLNVSVMSAVRP
jgi:NAD-dependent DNA ligase